MADHDERGQDSKPLAGVVLCSTSLGHDVRSNLATTAVDLGAVHLLDLTKEVTHLIVGNVNTPKYHFVAKHRPDVRVLKLDWLDEVRETWMECGEVKLSQLDAKHRFPTFGGLSICITGFTDIAERNKLEQIFRSNGASYSGDLSKQISHLVVAQPTGAKYEHAKHWGIRCVSFRWVTDCMERGMVLDESLYDPLLPEDKQGVGAFARASDVPRTAKRAAQEEESQASAKRRRFRRTASTRLETHSQDLWQGMSAPSAEGSSTLDQWTDEPMKENRKPTRQLQIKPDSPDPSEHGTAGQLLSDWHIMLHGFAADREKKLKHVLQTDCGARIVEKSQDLANGDDRTRKCVLVPHDPAFRRADLAAVPIGTMLATEWWVERCIMTKKAVEVDGDRLSQPFWPADKAKFKDTVVSLTGFSSLDVRQIASVVRLIGAKYEETLGPTTTVLIASTDHIKHEKEYYANRHGIPVVSVDWLWSSVANDNPSRYSSFKLSGETEVKAGQAAKDKPAFRGPFTADDEDESVITRQAQLRASPKKTRPALLAKQPLAERSPNASPPKQNLKDKPGPTPDKLSGKTIELLNAELASVSERLHLSRQNSADSQPRRRPRKLGKAASGILQRSVSIASIELSHDGCLDLFDEPGLRTEIADDKQPQGTQLGYEVPDAEEHRRHIAKKMGLSLDDENASKPLAGLGLVKDSDHGASRTRRSRAGRQ